MPEHRERCQDCSLVSSTTENSQTPLPRAKVGLRLKKARPGTRRVGELESWILSAYLKASKDGRDGQNLVADKVSATLVHDEAGMKDEEPLTS